MIFSICSAANFRNRCKGQNRLTKVGVYRLSWKNQGIERQMVNHCDVIPCRNSFTVHSPPKNCWNRNSFHMILITKSNTKLFSHTILSTKTPPGLKLRVLNENLIFLFLNQNICCGYSKEPSQWDSSFEHPKHMLKSMGKKIFTILHWKMLFV